MDAVTAHIYGDCLQVAEGVSEHDLHVLKEKPPQTFASFGEHLDGRALDLRIAEDFNDEVLALDFAQAKLSLKILG